MSFKEYLLNEMARQTDEKIVTYEEKDDKVRAILHTSKAGNVTRVGNELDRVLKELKSLKEQEKKLKEDLREICDDLFDEADEVITKFLVTQQVMITVGAVHPTKKEVFDWDGFFEEIAKICGLGVDSLKAIQKQFTKIEEGTKRSPSVRVKKLKKEALNEETMTLIQKIKTFVTDSVQAIQRLFSSPMEKRLRQLSQDLKLEGIDMDYDAILKATKK